MKDSHGTRRETLLAGLLLLLSALLHALWNAWIKKNGEPRIDSMGVLAVAWVCTAASIPFFPGPAFRSSTAIGWGIVSGFLEAGYFITLALALEQAPLGRAYTITRGGAMALVWLVSALLGIDRLTPLALMGILLASYGLLLTNRNPERDAAQGRTRWAWACATFIAGFHFCYSFALKSGAMPAALFLVSLSIGFPIYFVSSGRRVQQRFFKRVRARPFPLVVGGVVCASSFLVFLYGLSISKPGVAITLRNTSVVFAQLFALAIGERFIARQWVGAVLVTIGAICIGLKA